MLNLLIIAFLYLSPRIEPNSSQVNKAQVLTAAYGILRLGLVSIAIVAERGFLASDWVGLYSIVFLMIHARAMRIVFLNNEQERKREKNRGPGITMDGLAGRP